MRSSASPAFADATRAEVAAGRCRVRLRGDVVTGPGGQQIVFGDPSGNAVVLCQPAGP